MLADMRLPKVSIFIAFPQKPTVMTVNPPLIYPIFLSILSILIDSQPSLTEFPPNRVISISGAVSM
jgi:hypothetical protein